MRNRYHDRAGRELSSLALIEQDRRQDEENARKAKAEEERRRLEAEKEKGVENGQVGVAGEAKTGDVVTEEKK